MAKVIGKERAVSYGNDIAVTTSIVHVTCPECGVPYGLSAEFRRARRADHRNWYCPNGHSLWYPEGPDEAEALRRDLERATARETALRDQLGAAERSRRAHKAAATRMRNRAKAGVCPHPECKRSFADLGRHMTSQHPDWTES